MFFTKNVNIVNLEGFAEKLKELSLSQLYAEYTIAMKLAKENGYRKGFVRALRKSDFKRYEIIETIQQKYKITYRTASNYFYSCDNSKDYAFFKNTLFNCDIVEKETQGFIIGFIEALKFKGFSEDEIIGKLTANIDYIDSEKSAINYVKNFENWLKIW